MIQSTTVHQVDVFTREPFTGNRAGVVLNADGLTEAQMLAVAREMNLSETAFVFRSTTRGVVPVRFFTPTQEVPVCGHATLAAHYLRSAERGEISGTVMQESPGARWSIRWERRNGGRSVFMKQGPVQFGEELEGETRRDLLSALGVVDEALLPNEPVQVVSTGHAKVVVPIRSPEVLAAMDPDFPALRTLSEKTGVGGYFLFARDDSERDTFTACRVFAPAIGVDEDPVNGSGHGPLAAYLLEHVDSMAAIVRSGFWSRMGGHLGRPGRVWVQAAENGKTVEVGGEVTPVFSSEVAL